MFDYISRILARTFLDYGQFSRESPVLTLRTRSTRRNPALFRLRLIHFGRTFSGQVAQCSHKAGWPNSSWPPWHLIDSKSRLNCPFFADSFFSLYIYRYFSSSYLNYVTPTQFLQYFIKHPRLLARSVFFSRPPFSRFRPTFQSPTKSTTTTSTTPTNSGSTTTLSALPPVNRPGKSVHPWPAPASRPPPLLISPPFHQPVGPNILRIPICTLNLGICHPENYVLTTSRTWLILELSF